MNKADIEKLAVDYHGKLSEERKAFLDLASAEKTLDQIKTSLIASAYETGIIDGKNAQIRKAQEDSFLSENKQHIDAIFAIKFMKNKKEIATVNRKYQETLISLTKAFLYSQSGIGK